MPARIKKVCSLFYLLVFFFSSSSLALAQVVINEFSSNSNPEWVELYNNSSDQIFDLSGWKLVDENNLSADDLSLDGCIAPYSFRLFEQQTGKYWLNNDGDIISLKNQNDNLVDEVVAYGNKGSIPAPAPGQSASRNPTGGSNWEISDSPSPTNNNCQPTPTPTPEPTPTEGVPTEGGPTPTSPPKTATYKINEVHDEENNVLSQVEIYVDDQYIHHWAPEVLTFGEGRFCDEDQKVSCEFGEHIIRLTKKNFADWEETKNITGGGYHEPTIILKALSTPTPEPASPTPTSIPTPTPIPTQTLSRSQSSPSASFEESVFQDLSPAGTSSFPLVKGATDPEAAGEVLGESRHMDSLPLVLIASGLVLVIAAFFFAKKNFKKESPELA
jgi:hypothetical protein